MKKNIVLTSLFIVIVLLTACSQPSAEVVEEEETVLTVGGTEYSRPQLESIGSMSTDFTNKDGETTTYSGVPLTALLEDANLTSGGDTLVFTASDGYEADLPLEEALACASCIVAFDEDILRMVMPDMSGKLQVKDVIEINVK